MDAFGMGSSTTHSVHGPTFSPYSVNASAAFAALRGARPAPTSGWLTCGGSSGGSAVAVASGAVRAALGSDTGGSVRQPAAFCGVVGVKPTYGRVSRFGLVPYASSLDTVGVLARTVADAAHVLAVIAGHDQRDGTSLAGGWSAPWGAGSGAGLAGSGAECAGSGAGWAENSAGFPVGRTLGWAESGATSAPAATSARPLAGLRVGVPAQYHCEGIDAATLARWEWGCSALLAAGAQVVPVSLPHTRLALPAYYVIAPAEAASNLARYDGVGRYKGGGSGSGEGGSENAAADSSGDGVPPSTAGSEALAAWYSRSRSAAFGTETAHRVVTGNAALAADGRSEYYDAALAASRHVRLDFANVFRPHVGLVSGGSSRPASPSSSLAAPSLLAADNPAARPLAAHDVGVDVLLTPTTPAAPWPAHDTDSLPALAAALGDACTVPASLAHLPACSVPVGHAPYPPAALARAFDECGVDASCHAARALAQDLAVPVGLQVIGRYRDEATMLHVAAVLEAAALDEWGPHAARSALLTIAPADS